MTSTRFLIPAIALALTVSPALMPRPAAADTATNLVCNGCVHTKDIRDKAVTSAKIKDQTIKPADLANSAKPAGLASASGYQSIDLSNTPAIIKTVTVNAPAAGQVMVVASWYFYMGADGLGRCSLSTGSALDNNHLVLGEGKTGSTYVPGSSMRVFAVPSGPTTFNLVCDATTGTPSVLDTSIAGLYVPGSY